MGSDECVPPPVQIPDLRSLSLSLSRCISPSSSSSSTTGLCTAPPRGKLPYTRRDTSKQRTAARSSKGCHCAPGADSEGEAPRACCTPKLIHSTSSPVTTHLFPQQQPQPTSQFIQMAAEKPARATDASWRRICRPRLIREPARRINALFG